MARSAWSHPSSTWPSRFVRTRRTFLKNTRSVRARLIPRDILAIGQPLHPRDVTAATLPPNTYQAPGCQQAMMSLDACPSGAALISTALLLASGLAALAAGRSRAGLPALQMVSRYCDSARAALDDAIEHKLLVQRGVRAP